LRFIISRRAGVKGKEWYRVRGDKKKSGRSKKKAAGETDARCPVSLQQRASQERYVYSFFMSSVWTSKNASSACSGRQEQ
jgi:hypothetical protein